MRGDLWGLLSGNQGSKREIDKPPTNPKKDKIHTYYIMPIELRKNFYRRRGVRISYLKIVRGTLLVGGN
nr:hypothetical protein [Candidatus Freyarchaeota archaeon]